MGSKMRITKQERQDGRDEAARRAAEVAALVHEVRRNDQIGSHYTVWMTPSDRVEWWPGARHWRIGSADFHGEVSDFIAWLGG